MTDTAPSLAGAGVLITRPETEAPPLIDAVTAAGGEAHVLPLVELVPVSDPTPAREALSTLADGDWLLPVSPGAVRQLSQFLAAQQLTLPAVNFAAVGPGTARALEAAGWPAPVYPRQGDGAAALLADPAFAPSGQAQILIIRGEGGRRVLDEALAARGIPFRAVNLYRRCLPDNNTDQWLSWLDRDAIDIVMLTSATAVDHLISMTPDDWLPTLHELTVVAPSERVLQQAARQGFQGARLLAAEAGDRSMIQTAADWWQQNRKQS
jgi:uroporphyrinogen-III synthase